MVAREKVMKISSKLMTLAVLVIVGAVGVKYSSTVFMIAIIGLAVMFAGSRSGRY